MRNLENYSLDLLREILANGYFPKELPPCFSTNSFAKIRDNLKELPEGFSNEKHVKPCIHNLARAGSLPRRLSIVNPVPFLQLARCIDENWGFLKKKTQESGLSMSYPIEGKDGKRAIIPIKTPSELVEHRAQSRVSYRALLKADINNYYPSIYTHSISWALHGKSDAKNDHSDRLIGNRIDRLVRNCQDGQTMGIPIGPDTSLVLAEIVAAAIDNKLGIEVSNIEGFRHYDDYELVFDTQADAEQTLGLLQKCLSDFELSLNPRKTEIITLPCQLESAWVHNIRIFVFRSGSSQRGDLIHYFEMIFDFVKRFPDEHVVKYALTRLYKDNLVIESDYWPLAEKLVLQTMMLEPGGIAAGARILLEQKALGRKIDTVMVKKTINAIISRYGPIGNASEVAWALWVAHALGICMERRTARILTEIDDSVVAILVLDAVDKGLLKKQDLDISLWETYAKPDELYGPQWLLSYEAGVREWLGSGAYVLKDECFAYLKSKDVRFYEHITGDVLGKLSEKLESISPFEYNNNDVEEIEFDEF